MNDKNRDWNIRRCHRHRLRDEIAGEKLLVHACWHWACNGFGPRRPDWVRDAHRAHEDRLCHLPPG